MAAKISIKKVLVFLFWCLLASALVWLAVQATQKRDKAICQGFELKLTGEESQLFIDRKELIQLVTDNGKLTIKGKPVSSFNLKRMEEKLEKNRWIERAELYFDNLQMLQVVVSERIPVARVFSQNGKSFYLDTSAVALPLSDKVTARLPLFTGFPAGEKRWSGKDSLLASSVVRIGSLLMRDSLWMAQVAQVDITASGEFELIPTMGHHVIEIGDGSKLEQKFKKLRIFYQKVLAAKGLDAYERIRLQFNNQVVGVKSPLPNTKEDSLQAIRNVEELIRQSHQPIDTQQLKTDNL